MKIARRGLVAALSALAAWRPVFSWAKPDPLAGVPHWPAIGHKGWREGEPYVYDLHSQLGGEVIYGSVQVGWAIGDASSPDTLDGRRVMLMESGFFKDRLEGTKDDMRWYVEEFVFRGCGGPRHVFTFDVTDSLTSGYCGVCGAHKPENFTFTPDMAAAAKRALRNEGWPGY